jgi:hypothetical protein
MSYPGTPAISGYRFQMTKMKRIESHARQNNSE